MSVLSAGKGHTVLVASHSPAVLEAADHVIVMDRGRVVAQGKFSELRSTSETVQRLLSSE